MIVFDSRGRALTERKPVGRLIRAIENRYLPRRRWDMRLWLAVLGVLDRYRFVWRMP